MSEIPNIRYFIYFRLFFNARFYYPIFTILFLDFGLSLEQFALLNAVWAATIVIFEVPSGALADVMGRRNILVLGAALMIAEMSVLCIAPRGNPTWLFALFLANRILSGIAEAMVSGADEALAYDSLKQDGDISDWGAVIERQMRIQSLGYIVAMTIGAAVYDPHFAQRLADILNLGIRIDQDLTLRLPIVLTLVMAVATLITTLKMTEPQTDATPVCREPGTCWRMMASSLKLTLKAGLWILKTPWAVVIIFAGLLFDHVVRMLITLGSQYYRVILIPEAYFGLIGSALALMGVFVPAVGLWLAKRFSPMANFWLLAGLTWCGLWGLTLCVPFFGLAPMVLMFSVMMLMNYFVSYYLNPITESRQRATVLSFKGMMFNLSYGIMGIMYSVAVSFLRSRPDAAGLGENAIFKQSLAGFPWYFIVVLAIFAGFAAYRLKDAGAYEAAAKHSGPEKRAQ